MGAKGTKTKGGTNTSLYPGYKSLNYVKTEKGKCIATFSRLKDREYQFINIKFHVPDYCFQLWYDNLKIMFLFKMSIHRPRGTTLEPTPMNSWTSPGASSTQTGLGTGEMSPPQPTRRDRIPPIIHLLRFEFIHEHYKCCAMLAEL